MRVTFLGGVRMVTGSATLFEKGALKWLVDCGMFQGGREIEKKNHDTRSYDPKNLSFILLTHAHIDHSGLIPKLVREGFQGKVICTKATLDLCEVMLKDSGHIQETEAEWYNRKKKRSGGKRTEPLYTVQDAERSLRLFSPVNYDEVISLANGFRVRFQDAGHILGSAIIELWVEGEENVRKLVFSGDLGNAGQPIVRDPSVIREADMLWLESTYGNRLHKPKEETIQELLKIVKEAITHQAKVIIPAFALERTQNIIYTLGQFIREGVIPSLPVYIDSPLAISATEVFKKNSDCFDRETREILLRGENPLDLPEIVYTRTTEESKMINEDKGAGIIISASGMCEAGRIKHHLKHHLWQEKSHIVFIGYQSEGTVGRRIIDGAKNVRLFGEEIAVRAHIHTLGGFSAHADQKGLLEWLSHFENPQLEVIINHGEEKISMEFVRLIRERFGLRVNLPQWRETRFLFGSEKIPEHEEAIETGMPETTLHLLLRHLDRNYKKLRRKLKRWKRMGEESQKPQRMKQLEEVNRRIEELESEL